MKWAALLKGINLGGRKLPMADLKALVENLGYGEAKTLLASGNVLFDAGTQKPAEIEAALEKALVDYGLKTDVVVRNGEELAEVIRANPFVAAARDHPNHLLVAFHRDPVPGGLIEKLADIYHGPERLRAVGRELYIDYPDDVGHSKLGQAMAKVRFPALATARNWNTIGKLAELLD